MKKQFALMFCLLAIFTCLVGCSTGSKASFPETFIGSVGQEKADALKTLGVTEQALSDYTVDVYGKTADVQLSFVLACQRWLWELVWVPIWHSQWR